MVIGTPSGQSYEDEMHYALGIPTFAEHYDPKSDVFDVSQNLSSSRQDSTQGEEKDHKLFFVRHGETEDNEDNIIREKDSKLTDIGRKQAEKAARQLKSEGVDAIVSSNLPRAKESAHIIASKLGIVPQFDDKLNTWDMGSLEGQPCDATNTKQMKDAVEKTPDEPLGGAESFNDFKDRSQAGIRDAINNNQGKKLAILTHSKVEATLKAWNKTGQDNPEIDAPTVNSEPDKPGSVEPFTMKSDSTIMQPEMGLNSEVFKERFGDYWKQNLPMSSQTDKGEVPGWWQSGPKPSPEFNKMDRQQRREELQRQLNRPPVESDEGDLKTDPYAKFTPVSEYMPFSPSQEKSIEDLAAKHGLEGSKVLNFLKELKPEDIIGTGNLGGITTSTILRRPGNLALIKKMFEGGSSLKDVADHFGVSRNTIAGVANREGLKTRNVLRGQEPKESSTPYKPKLEGSEGDPEYEKALSDWYKNFSEGGPIEPEVLKNQYPEVYKKMMEEFEKTNPEAFNTANRSVTQLNKAANTNKPFK